MILVDTLHYITQKKNKAFQQGAAGNPVNPIPEWYGIAKNM